MLPKLPDRVASDAWIAETRAHWVEHGFGLWALEIPGEAELIGSVGLHVVPFPASFPSVLIAWRLGHPYWGRGYAFEAARMSRPILSAFTRNGDISMTNQPCFAALDVSLEKTTICVMSLDGIILREVVVTTDPNAIATCGQRHPDRGIAGPTDGSVPICLPRLAFARRQAEAGPGLLGGSEAIGLVGRGPECHGDDGACTRGRHQPETAARRQSCPCPQARRRTQGNRLPLEAILFLGRQI